MNKDKEVEVVDSREEKVDLMVKVTDLKVLCRIKENLNGRMMTKERPNGKMVILTEEVLILIEEEVILILEVDFMVIILDVVNKGIDPLKVGKVKKNTMIQGDDEGSPSGPKAGEILSLRRTLCNKGCDEEPILRRSLFKTICKMSRKCCKVIVQALQIWH